MLLSVCLSFQSFAWMKSQAISFSMQSVERTHSPSTNLFPASKACLGSLWRDIQLTWPNQRSYQSRARWSDFWISVQCTLSKNFTPSLQPATFLLNRTRVDPRIIQDWQQIMKCQPIGFKLQTIVKYLKIFVSEVFVWKITSFQK